MVKSMKNRSDKNTHRFKAVVLAVVLLAACCVSAQAAVKLEVDRMNIVEGETVTLTFLTDDASQGLDADFSVLEEQFHILDQRKETQVSIVNGRQAAVVRLLLTVEPKRAGTLQIPSIDFGQAQTRPVTLEVQPAPELQPGELPPVFIEVELTPEQGSYYVHAQFGLVVRVFYKLNLTEAAISQPEPSPASIRLLQETPYHAERAGERYRVLERNYAIFPERSGTLVIPPMELSGRLVERRSGGLWQPQSRGRRIRVESEELTLQIEPRPQAFSGTEWQPAREFVLSQQVSSSDTLRVGEPVTRTVLVDAVGLEENMIVEPQWPELAGARVYPDQPQGITRDDGRWVLGHKEFRYAVVPEQEGELVLPELTLDWWDTVNNVQRTARLPAHTLQVKPSALVPPPAPGPGISDQASVSAPQADTRGTSTDGFWRSLALLFAALWLATLALAWRRWNSPSDRRPAGGIDAEAESGEKQVLKALKDASHAGDRKAARRCLQRWLHLQGAGDDSVLEFATAANDPALAESIYDLDADGFRPDTQRGWDGKAFWKLFQAWREARDKSGSGQPAAITDLYARENRRA